jgi:hypothetical protein
MQVIEVIKVSKIFSMKAIVFIKKSFSKIASAKKTKKRLWLRENELNLSENTPKS